MKKIFLFCILSLFLIVNFCSAESLKIKMLNVGQGDAILIQTDSQNILVDTSDTDERAKLSAELTKAGVTKFDKIILTHPHADHIGNINFLIDNFPVAEIYDNGKISASKTYLKYISNCQTKNISHNSLNSGDTLTIGENIFIEIYHPQPNTFSKNINDDSIVGRLVFNNFSMLLTGDAEFSTEADLVFRGVLLQSNILKAGHHGAATANNLNFVKKVSPQFVLISAGVQTSKRGGNTYGHPRAEALNAYLAANVPTENIFWTAINGTVTIETDGLTYTVTPEFQTNWLTDYLKGKSDKVNSVSKL